LLVLPHRRSIHGTTQNGSHTLPIWRLLWYIVRLALAAVDSEDLHTRTQRRIGSCPRTTTLYLARLSRCDRTAIHRRHLSLHPCAHRCDAPGSQVCRSVCSTAPAPQRYGARRWRSPIMELVLRPMIGMVAAGCVGDASEVHLPGGGAPVQDSAFGVSKLRDAEQRYSVSWQQQWPWQECTGGIREFKRCPPRGTSSLSAVHTYLCPSVSRHVAD
jgi:hypothetical protein